MNGEHRPVVIDEPIEVQDFKTFIGRFSRDLENISKIDEERREDVDM